MHAIETRRVAGLSGALGQGGRLQVVGAATDLLRLTRPSLANAQDRKVKTLWEVAEQAGLRTAVVNWWATWPASAGTGLMITDRAVLRLEHGGALDGEIGPPALYEALRARWPAMRERAAASTADAFTQVGDADVVSTLRRSASLDVTIIELFRSLPPPARDLDVVYLPGLDIAQNSLLGSSASATASSVASRVDALGQYYAFLDRAIAPLLEEDAKTTVVLVTQPGRVRSSAGGVFAVWPGLHESVEGDVAVGLTPQAVARPVAPAPVDVAPTILGALGVPLSRELQGRAEPALFDLGFATCLLYTSDAADE